MSKFSGIPYRNHIVRWGNRKDDFDALHAAVTAGHPCPLYVGDRIPRHVVLAVTASAGDVQVYNPAHGRLVELTRSEFEAGRLTTFGRWIRPWFLVLPRAAAESG